MSTSVILPGFVDAKEAEEITGRHVSTLNRMAQQKLIEKRHYRVEGRKAAACFKREDLEKYRQTASTRAQPPAMAPVARQALQGIPARSDAIQALTAAITASVRSLLPPPPPKGRTLQDLAIAPTLTLKEAVRYTRLCRAALKAIRDAENPPGFWTGAPLARSPRGRFLFVRTQLEQYLESL